MVFTRVILVALALSASSVVGLQHLAGLTFSVMDVDSDGEVTGDEIAAVVSGLGIDIDARPENIMFYIMEADTNLSGGVDEDEFNAAIASTTEEQFQNVFNAYDADSNGSVTEDELAAVNGIASDEAAAMFASIDKDGDGGVSFPEFQLSVLTSASA